MRVHWTNTAVEHLDAIYRHVSLDSPKYALFLVDRLTLRTQQIAHHPWSGRRVPEWDMEQVREVIEGRYRIIYHIKPDQIDVVAVIHGAMNIIR